MHYGSTTVRWVALIAFVAGITSSASVSRVGAQENDEEPELLVRVYDVGDLIVPINDYTFEATRIPTAVEHRPASSIRGAAGGMGGMGGGMGGMGGGMMRVGPSETGGGTGGMGNGRIAGHGTGMTNLPGDSADAESARLESLTDVIVVSVAPFSWDVVGGFGSIASFGSSLIISQTAAVHDEIVQLLDLLRHAKQSLRSVTIEADWLELASGDLDSLYNDAEGGEADTRQIDWQRFDELRGRLPAIRGRITCFNRQTVHLISGRAGTRLTGVIPVVGSDPGYQPVSAVHHVGALLEVRPSILHDRVILDVNSTVMSPGNETEPIPFLNGVLPLDRVDVLVQQLATTVAAPINQPVLVGGLTREPDAAAPGEGGGAQIYLFLTARPAGAP